MSGNLDGIEFYLERTGRLLVSVDSSHAPDRGDLVNIRKATYRVIGRTYTVDQADDSLLRQVVCVINLEEVAPTKDPQP